MSLWKITIFKKIVEWHFCKSLQDSWNLMSVSSFYLLWYVIFGLSLWRKSSLTEIYIWQVEEYFNSLFRWLWTSGCDGISNSARGSFSKVLLRCGILDHTTHFSCSAELKSIGMFCFWNGSFIPLQFCSTMPWSFQ